MSDLADQLLAKAANDGAVSDDVFRIIAQALTGKPFDWEASPVGVESEDLSAWTTCNGCGRAMTEDQAERPHCSHRVLCGDCMADHGAGCLACGAS